MKKDYIREYVTIGGMLLGLMAMILGKMSFTELMVFSICLHVIDIKTELSIIRYYYEKDRKNRIE